MHKAHEVTIESVPDAAISEQTDAVIRVTRACICGSDLWPYNDLPQTPGGRPMGHEAIGFVEDVGGEVQSIRRGQLVIMPFAYSDGTCTYCRNQLQTSCIQGGFFGSPEVGGAQAEALRIPFADGTLYPISAEVDDSLMPALLTLSDVMGTGHHAALTARVAKGGSVAVIGDGAVGLCGVIAARRLGADQIILLGRHRDRTELGTDFGATDVVQSAAKKLSRRCARLLMATECIPCSSAWATRPPLRRRSTSFVRAERSAGSECPITARWTSQRGFSLTIL